MTRRPDWVARTEETIDEHTAPAPGDRKYATGDEAHSRSRRVLRHEQQDEIAQSWYGLGFMTDAQFKGALIGALVGAVIGAAVLLPFGLIAGDGVGPVWRLALAALCGALAGATAVAIYLGGREPELEGETQDVDDGPSIGTTLRDPHTDDRGR
jgi:hypothetical protein